MAEYPGAQDQECGSEKARFPIAEDSFAKEVKEDCARIEKQKSHQVPHQEDLSRILDAKKMEGLLQKEERNLEGDSIIFISAVQEGWITFEDVVKSQLARFALKFLIPGNAEILIYAQANGQIDEEKEQDN